MNMLEIGYKYDKGARYFMVDDDGASNTKFVSKLGHQIGIFCKTLSSCDDVAEVFPDSTFTVFRLTEAYERSGADLAWGYTYALVDVGRKWKSVAVEYIGH